MPGLVDCGVVLRTALPSGNAFFQFTSFDQSLQGLVSTVYLRGLNSAMVSLCAKFGYRVTTRN